MKFLVLISLLASMAAVQAKEVFTQTFDVYSRAPYSSMVNAHAKFYVDLEAGQGLMDVNAYEYVDQPYPRYPRRCGPYYCDYPMPPMPTSYQILNAKVEIPGLVVEGKELIYKGEEGDVLCATLGRTRWLGNLQINLTGNCELKTRYRYRSSTVTVSFDVK